MCFDNSPMAVEIWRQLHALDEIDRFLSTLEPAAAGASPVSAVPATPHK